ncbi:MAG: histidinol dehydrogenase [Neoaquamicrobium sediminum]|uniref:histidinol dehydrogenase n=1 Tax=Neoaquamicrobium sediminum TaxID=1849104 RepID=UPI0040373060
MTSSIRIHDLSALSDADRLELLQRTENDLSYFLERVPAIIEAVRTEGDEALARFAREFDRAPVTPNDIAAADADCDAAFQTLDPQMVETLRYAADNIRRYHQAQMPDEMWMKEIRPGVLVGERFTPIDSVALYSPRGKGSFPSVTLMTAIPAVVAGVENVIILTPPGPDGKVDPATLVAARLSGVEKVFKAGGAQAVAAAAYGTETIPRCLKIEGPGSPWFMAAKQQLAGRIDSRLPAGPSESLIFVDETSDPRLAALDLLVESEHGADSSVFLVTWSRAFAEAVCAAAPEFWARMSPRRVEFSQAVLGGDNGGVILAGSPEEAYRFINDYAPEHLQILSKTPFAHLTYIRNASEILLGEETAGAIANYMMGPNCVLPTSGAAKVHSPLGVHDFLKSASVGHMTASGYAEMAPHTRRIATYEGFDAHANSVSELRGS